MSKEIQIKQECCDIWNNLKDKSKMIDYLIESKQQIADLEAKLAEKEKEIEKLNVCVNFYKSYYISFNEKVINELGRVKEKILPEISSYVKREFVVKEFDNQIKQLKGENQ